MHSFKHSDSFTTYLYLFIEIISDFLSVQFHPKAMISDFMFIILPFFAF
jgi:hypothetical protein